MMKKYVLELVALLNWAHSRICKLPLAGAVPQSHGNTRLPLRLPLINLADGDEVMTTVIECDALAAKQNSTGSGWNPEIVLTPSRNRV
jgi:hypothetical protein